MESGRLWRFDILSVVVFVALLTARCEVENTAILSYRIVGSPRLSLLYEPHNKYPMLWATHKPVYMSWKVVLQEKTETQLLGQRQQWLLKVLYPPEIKPGIWLWLCNNSVMFSSSAPLGFSLPWPRILNEWPWSWSGGVISAWEQRLICWQTEYFSCISSCPCHFGQLHCWFLPWDCFYITQ